MTRAIPAPESAAANARAAGSRRSSGPTLMSVERKSHTDNPMRTDTVAMMTVQISSSKARMEVPVG